MDVKELRAEAKRLLMKLPDEERKIILAEIDKENSPQCWNTERSRKEGSA